MKLLQRIRHKLTSLLQKTINKKAFEEDFLKALPNTLISPAQYLFYESSTPEETHIAKLVEAYRSKVSTLKFLH